MITDPQLLRQQAEILAAGLPQLMVSTERVAQSLAPGTHGRRRVGQGETFWQFRRYQQGDPAQAIDWRQSAKSQPVYVREHEWEAAQSVWLWRDDSPSMSYSSHRSVPEKRERADTLLLALAILLLRGGENVALLEEGAPPGHGSATLERITFRLARQASMSPRGRSDATGLPTFRVLPRYGQLVLIGDFLAPIEDIEARLRRFAAGALGGHVLQVLDPAEETLPFSGRTRFEGLEDEGDVLIRRAEKARQQYIDRLAAQQDGLKRICRDIGWTFTAHRTDRPGQTALLALYATLADLGGG